MFATGFIIMVFVAFMAILDILSGNTLVKKPWSTILGGAIIFGILLILTSIAVFLFRHMP